MYLFLVNLLSLLFDFFCAIKYMYYICLCAVNLTCFRVRVDNNMGLKVTISMSECRPIVYLCECLKFET